jgi:hypothetical protein
MNITEPGNKVKDPGLKILAEASAFTHQSKQRVLRVRKGQVGSPRGN